MAKRKGTQSTQRSRKSSTERSAKSSKGTKRKAARKVARKAAPKKRAAAKRTAKKATKRAAVRKAPKRTAAKKATPKARKTARKSSAGATTRKQATPRKKAPVVVARKTPSLNRERRTVQDDDLVQSTPPSSLDLDRTASAARSGRKGLANRFAEHNESSPALTGGDVDADWEGAYASGDEAPGGDNPTPDQDIVDDIGRAVGIEYQDNEELKGADKVAKRDQHRWELDPASSEDYDDRD